MIDYTITNIDGVDYKKSDILKLNEYQLGELMSFCDEATLNKIAAVTNSVDSVNELMRTIK